MRSRNTKPSFFKDEELADCGPHIQILLMGLDCLADREGRLENRPRQIKAEIFPYYDFDIHGGLTVLERLGHVVFYEVSGRKLIEVTGFSERQRPHHTEAKSSIPPRDCNSTNFSSQSEPTVNPPLEHGGNPPSYLITDHKKEVEQSSSACEPFANKKSLRMKIQETINSPTPMNLDGLQAMEADGIPEETILEVITREMAKYRAKGNLDCPPLGYFTAAIQRAHQKNTTPIQPLPPLPPPRQAKGNGKHPTPPPPGKGKISELPVVR